MICQRCLNGAAVSVGITGPSSSSKLPRLWPSGASRTEWMSRRRRLTSSQRTGQQVLSTATLTPSPAQQTPDISALAQVTASSPSGAQLSSTSAGPSPQAATATTATRPKRAIRSSAPAGQPLRGLNYLKNQNDPVALPDSEYPAWLWTCLEPKQGKKDDGAKRGSDKAGTQMRFFSSSSAHRTRFELEPLTRASGNVQGSSARPTRGAAPPARPIQRRPNPRCRCSSRASTCPRTRRRTSRGRRRPSRRGKRSPTNCGASAEPPSRRATS